MINAAYSARDQGDDEESAGLKPISNSALGSTGQRPKLVTVIFTYLLSLK